MAKIYTWKLKEKIYDGRGMVTQLKLMLECEDGDRVDIVPLFIF